MRSGDAIKKRLSERLARHEGKTIDDALLDEIKEDVTDVLMKILVDESAPCLHPNPIEFFVQGRRKMACPTCGVILS